MPIYANPKICAHTYRLRLISIYQHTHVDTKKSCGYSRFINLAEFVSLFPNTHTFAHKFPKILINETQYLILTKRKQVLRFIQKN